MQDYHQPHHYSSSLPLPHSPIISTTTTTTNTSGTNSPVTPPSSSRRRKTTKSSAEFQFVLAKYGLSTNGELQASYLHQQQPLSNMSSFNTHNSLPSSLNHQSNHHHHGMSSIPQIVKSGYLMKQGIKWRSWKKRYFILVDDILIYKCEVDSPVIGLLQLQNGSVNVDEKNKRMFHVKCEKSFSKDKIYNERSYTFQICSEDHEEEREDWVQKVKRAATQHVRSRMRTRTRANGGAAGSNNSLMVGDRSSRRNASSNDSSQNGGGTKGVESRKIVAIVVTHATSNIGMEVVKSLLLRKIRVIAVCHPSNFIPPSSNNNENERKGSFNTVSKEELLKNYGAIVIRLENGFRRFEEASLVEQIKEKQYHISCVVHIPLDHEYIVEDMNHVINFALQLSVDSFFLCSRYFPQPLPSVYEKDSKKNPISENTNQNGSEEKAELPELFNCHLQCEQMVKTYFGHSCRILRCNGTMQDFLLFYDEKTRNFYFPFGDLKDVDDKSKKRVSWVDARDVGLCVCTMIMNIMFQVSSTMSSQPPKPLNSGFFFISQSHSSSEQYNEKKHRTTFTLSGPESLTIKDVITKFSKKTNVPVEYKIIDREQSIHRLMLSKGLRKWECDAYHDVYTRIYDEGLAMAIYPDVQDIKKSDPTPFDSFIERELETFQDHNPCVCMIGSIHFIQSKLLHSLHEMNYLSKNIIFSKKEIPDYPFKTAQYIVFEYEKEKKNVESKVKIEMMEEARKRRTEEILVQTGMITVPFKTSRSASFHDIESEDTTENRIKTILQEKFIDIVSDAVIQCEKLIFFIKAKYILNKWFDVESFKKVIDNSQRSTKLKHIILLYDSATKKICPDFLTKISIYLSMKCKTSYTMVEFGWLYQTFAILSGSEIQTYASLSVPVSSTIDVLNDRLEWCDGDDVIEFILYLLQNIKLDSEQMVKNFVCHGTKASFREIARLMHEVLKKPVSCSAIDISKSFPCLYIDNKDLFEHRSMKKEMVYYLTMVKEDSTSVENYSSDCLEFEAVMGKPLKTFKEFVEESLIMFADIIELHQCEFDFFQEMSSCNSIDEQEHVIFKHLMNRIKNSTSLFHRVVQQKSRQFLNTYSQDYYHSLTTEEKLIVISRAKSLIASFFDEMYRVLARQVMKIIIPEAANYGVTIKVDPNQMEPLFSQCIDYVFFDQVFPLVLELYKREYSVKSEVVNQKYLELAKCTPKHLEIADDYCLDQNGKSAEENYALAIESLRRISQCNSLVEGKMKLLMETSKAIVECVKLYHGKEKEVSADALMPIFIFVLIKAAIPDLYCQFKILEDFVHESIMMGPMGYSLVTLQIAIDYMQTLQWEQLDQTFQIQMDLKRQQEEFQRQRDSEIQLRKTRGFSVMLNAPPTQQQAANKFSEESHHDSTDEEDDNVNRLLEESSRKTSLMSVNRSMSIMLLSGRGGLTTKGGDDDEEENDDTSSISENNSPNEQQRLTQWMNNTSPYSSSSTMSHPSESDVSSSSSLMTPRSARTNSSPRNSIMSSTLTLPPQTPDKLYEEDVFSVSSASGSSSSHQSTSSTSGRTSFSESTMSQAAKFLKATHLSANEAVELSVILLRSIIEIYNASEWISQTRFNEKERMGWGKLLRLGNEFIVLTGNEDTVDAFTQLTYKLELVDVMELKSKKHLLTVFLLNIYHVMLLHGFIKNGTYPLMSMKSRTRFLREPMYVIGSIPLSLDDIFCLLTSAKNVSNSRKHELLKDVYQRDPLNCLALSNCCFSSPHLRIYYPASPELVKAQLIQQATCFLAQTVKFFSNTKLLVLPSTLSQHLSLFGDNKETVINWIINHLPKDLEIRKDISIAMTYTNIHIKFSPVDYSFQFKVAE